MKKIVPFNNVLTFNTDVCEITAISLEHDIKTSPETISGTFFISGEYKIIDGQLEKEKFNFELPFDIALGSDYNLDTLVVDIDDFRYELIDRNKLKVNIDLYIDGEILKEEVVEEIKDEEDIKEEKTEEEDFNSLTESDELRGDEVINTNETLNIDDIKEEYDEEIKEENNNLTNDIITNTKEDNMEQTDINVENNNENINIFNAFNEEEKYVTYRVYRVKEDDTTNKILEKYNITKEELSKYNNVEDIKPGDKLIIPYNDK